MDIEYDVKVVPINADHTEAIKKMQDDGWELMPGVMPVGVYHVIRQKNKPKIQSSAGMGQLVIDDALVHVIGPDGKIKQ